MYSKKVANDCGGRCLSQRRTVGSGHPLDCAQWTRYCDVLVLHKGSTPSALPCLLHDYPQNKLGIHCGPGTLNTSVLALCALAQACEGDGSSIPSDPPRSWLRFLIHENKQLPFRRPRLLLPWCPELNHERCGTPWGHRGSWLLSIGGKKHLPPWYIPCGTRTRPWQQSPSKTLAVQSTLDEDRTGQGRNEWPGLCTRKSSNHRCSLPSGQNSEDTLVYTMFKVSPWFLTSIRQQRWQGNTWSSAYLKEDPPWVVYLGAYK